MRGTEGERRARRAAARAGRRLRYRAGLDRLAFWLPLPLGYAAAALSALKFGGFGAHAQRPLIGLAGFLLLLSVALTLRALFRAPPRWAGALALDQHHGLGDRVTTALALLETPESRRTDFDRAAIEDGLQRAKQLDPRGAVPVPIPRELGVSALLLLALLGAGWFEVRVERVLPPPPRFEPLVMAADDLELFGEITRRLAERAEDPESVAAIRRFNALVEDIAARRLERREAFERMSDLEAELAKSADLDREARELGLSELARELGKSGLAKPAAQAIAEKRLADAEQALRELAEKIKNKGRPPSRAELDRLRSAAEQASRVSGERSSAIEQRRRELMEEKKSLLKRKDQGKRADTEAKLEENKRKLERLERDKNRAERAARELSDLDRELAKAAEDLAKERQAGAEDIRRSADELSKVQKKALGDKEKRELLERLRELKELLRQQGQAGKERQRQMARFGRRARGGSGSGEEGEERGKGQRPGAAQPAGIDVIQVPRISRVPGGGPTGADQRPGSGQPTGDSSGPSAGKEWGKGHDPNLTGDATALKGETHEVSAAAVDTGQGTASAEVIHGAAERGFVGKGYRDVYVQYETVAEQSLEHDQVPPGYRFYVRRYFQLIRPRE